MEKTQNERTVLFVTKATPEDNEFTEWLAPRLEAAGYQVFADILNLEGGERWRKTGDRWADRVGEKYADQAPGTFL